MKRTLEALDNDLEEAARAYMRKKKMIGPDDAVVPAVNTESEDEDDVVVPFEDLGGIYMSALPHVEPHEADLVTLAKGPYGDPKAKAAARRVMDAARSHLAAAHVLVLSAQVCYGSNDALDVIARAIPEDTQGLSSVHTQNIEDPPCFNAVRTFKADAESAADE